MRRIDSKNRKKAVREQALAQFRATERKLKEDHPELMEELKRQISPYKQEGRENRELQEHGRDTSVDDLIPVDRRKNMATVLKFLEISPCRKALQQKLRELLAD